MLRMLLKALQQAAVPVPAISTSNITADAVVQLDDTTGIAAGMIVSGIGVPAGTTVVTNDSANSAYPFCTCYISAKHEAAV